MSRMITRTRIGISLVSLVVIMGIALLFPHNKGSVVTGSFVEWDTNGLAVSRVSNRGNSPLSCWSTNITIFENDTQCLARRVWTQKRKLPLQGLLLHGPDDDLRVWPHAPLPISMPKLEPEKQKTAFLVCKPVSSDVREWIEVALSKVGINIVRPMSVVTVDLPANRNLFPSAK